ncbi:MAG: hypothetical protein LBP69_02815 [Treponema sp.]|jgi:hypothetical protein|nr:hypothetical protein [Treponema sp.]
MNYQEFREMLGITPGKRGEPASPPGPETDRPGTNGAPGRPEAPKGRGRKPKSGTVTDIEGQTEVTTE